ncbi:MAG: hypothetical protein KJ718_03600 [Nanoarchaeota archaeon]|nr:hypothetical protein [Nanoarchaeota archaeon]MBU1051615.1 hypothetical protein [Nanoarchaeota archaeon]MBU1988886.1 hypothetical protein [Nanoarchaeota archaeon]
MIRTEAYQPTPNASDIPAPLKHYELAMFPRLTVRYGINPAMGDLLKTLISGSGAPDRIAHKVLDKVGEDAE